MCVLLDAVCLLNLSVSYRPLLLLHPSPSVSGSCVSGRGGTGASSEDLRGAERGVTRRAPCAVGQVQTNAYVFLMLWLNLCVCDTCVCFVCSRVGVYVNTFQNMAKHQEKFHREMSKVRAAGAGQPKLKPRFHRASWYGLVQQVFINIYVVYRGLA